MQSAIARIVASFVAAFAFVLTVVILSPPLAHARADTSTDAIDSWRTVEGSGSLDALAPDGTRLGPCPLTHTDVAIDISGFVARVKVTQRFENRFSEAVEAVYTFPLSERAAVDAMWMRTGDRVIRGSIARREDARKIYEAARDAGQLAGLLDQERPNVFTQSVANLVPGAAVEIEIHYVEPLAYEAGTFELVFPTVVGPRFVPGAPIGHSGSGWADDTNRVPDASRLTPPVTPPGTRAGHDLRLSVDIDAGVPLVDVTAPLHDVVVTRPDPQHARVRLRKQHDIPNRDFVLRYAVAGDRLRSGYLVHKPTDGGDGWLSLVLLPPKRVTAATAAPKEVVFVIDRSGSQSGRPLEAAKATVLWILDHLNPNDTFQIVDFGSTANQLFSRPELATDGAKRKAREHLATVEANGSTMMAEAIEKVCAMPADGNRLRIVTFMTDGYVGNDFEVLELVRQLRGRSRWFPFGTGNSVNRFLIDGMAREGGGEAEYVLLDGDTEAIARRFYDRIASPVLTDVTLEAQGLTLLDVAPQRLRDVWAERPVVVHARYRQPGRGRVVLRGFQQGQPYEETIDVTLPEREDDHEALASMWARAQVEDLMAEDLKGAQSGEMRADVRERIVQLALAHGLLTQFTSFVAVEDRVVNEGGVQRRVAVPVEMPDGVRYEGVFGGAQRLVAQDATRITKMGAVTERRAAAAPAVDLPLALGAARPRTEATLADRDDAAAPAAKPADEKQPTTDNLDESARHRLSPALVALLETGSAAGVHLDGVRVEISVKLQATDPATLRLLAEAGFDVQSRQGDCATGWVEIGKLAALAKIADVDRIVPTPQAAASGADACAA